MTQVYRWFRPLVFLQEPEKAHDRIVKVGKFLGNNSLVRGLFNYEDKRLNVEVNGIRFENPIGLAAGFDKNAVLTDFVESLGFGFEEVGSVSLLPREGNEKPRLFRLVEDFGVINRMGLNNHGAHVINKRLEERSGGIPLGVNIAKTHDSEIMGEEAIMDFVECYRVMCEGDYVVLNISCPNTAEGKTFEDAGILRELLEEIGRVRRNYGDARPLFVKVSPDLDEIGLSELLGVCEDFGVNGYVAVNTSSRRDGLLTDIKRLWEIGLGGLSGEPIKERSTKMIRKIYHETCGEKTVIGIGGIFNSHDAYEKILAGASLVQLYTGMVYEGPGIVKRIKMGLVELMERDGVSSLGEIVGKG